MPFRAINELWNIAFDADLFATMDRREPGVGCCDRQPDLGTSSSTSRTICCQTTSGQRGSTLPAPKTDANGNNIGTLGRLQELIRALSSTATVEGVRSVLEPLRQVRKERQAPAHKIVDTVTDGNVVNRQRDLLRDIAYSLDAVRAFVQTHPAVRSAGWEPPKYLNNWQWL